MLTHHFLSKPFLLEKWSKKALFAQKTGLFARKRAFGKGVGKQLPTVHDSPAAHHKAFLLSKMEK